MVGREDLGGGGAEHDHWQGSTQRAGGKGLAAERSVMFTQAAGLHLRPASLLAQAAGRYAAAVELEVRGRRADARSIMGVLKLGVQHGDTVLIRATGAEAEQAAAAVAALLEGEPVA